MNPCVNEKKIVFSRLDRGIKRVLPLSLLLALSFKTDEASERFIIKIMF